MKTDSEIICKIEPAGALNLPRGHREDYYLLANCRRLLTHYKWRNAENWVIAMELFATGSTSAKEICAKAGIDPYSKKIERR